MHIKKRAVIVTAIPLAIAGTMAAVAFVTNSFDASGKGGTAGVQPLSGTVTGIPTDLGPGDSAPIVVHVSNPNHFQVHEQSATFSIDAPSAPGCPAGSFVIDTIQYPARDVPGGSSTSPGTADAVTARINFINSGEDQTGCLNKAVQVTAHVS